METTTSIVQLGGLAAIFLFLWKLHTDIVGLRNAWPESRVGSRGDSRKMTDRVERKESKQKTAPLIPSIRNDCRRMRGLTRPSGFSAGDVI